MSVQGEAKADFRDHLIRYGGDTYPEIVEKAQGCYVWDATGKKILDFTSGQMCATVGHNHPNIVAAIRKSCDTALHLFSGMIPRSVVQLAEAMAKIVPEAARRSRCSSTPAAKATRPRSRWPSSTPAASRSSVSAARGTASPATRARCPSPAIARATDRACRARS